MSTLFTLALPRGLVRTRAMTYVREGADPLAELALAARDGDSVAFTKLYERTRDLAWKALYSVVGASPELEDLLQESYLQLLKSLKGFRGDSKVTTFLHRVCVNTALMHLRSRRRRPEDPVEEMPVSEAGPDSDPARAAEVAEAVKLTRDALAKMSEEKAAVVAYHDLLGLGPEEISQLVDAPVNTVRSRLNRGRQEFTELVAKAMASSGGGGDR
jgi:RNA polymerase sigma-70 factor, ECF subfamily